MNLKSARISTRLALLTACLLALLTIVGGAGIRGLAAAEAGLNGVYSRNTVPLVTLGELIGEVSQSRALVVAGMGADSSEASEKYYQGVKPGIQRVDALWTAYEQSVASADPAALEKARQLAGLWRTYAASGDQVIATAKSGDFEAAATLMRGDSAKHFEALREAIVQAMQQQRSSAKAAFDATHAGTAATHQLVIVVLAVGLALGAGLSWFIVGTIRRPLTRALKVAEQVAEGDLHQTIQVDSRDELGQLLAALAAMQERLRNVVADVRRAADSISTASNEIATGTGDLSQRTEQTAFSLQATSSSMTQFSGTLVQTADSARQANSLSAEAVSVAGRGGSAVAQVVQTMDEITSSSRRVTDIIGVIDGIAFQTNILALNAAVEAARAGEQGRGFAVVASEVRTLAGRSAEAAREIKRLIAASAEQVEGGTALVAAAGRTMDEIVDSVRRVTGIIGEISAASAEQSQGIHQMASSVQHLDEMTQQNAALVEQSAAAAESLKEQAARLVQVVSVFKLV